jgi:hypothetical protein
VPCPNLLTLPELRARAETVVAALEGLWPDSGTNPAGRRRVEALAATARRIVADLDTHPALVTKVPGR